LLYLVKYIKHLPVIYTEHDISILSFKNSYYRKNRLLFDYFDYLKRIYFHAKIYKNLDRVITLSLEDKKVLTDWFPYTKLEYIPTGVDLEYFSFKAKDRRDKIYRLIFIGHYPHFPNEDAVIYFANKIYPLIRKKIKDIEFLIVGSNPTESVMRLSKKDGIKVIGTVDDVRPYLYMSDVFVNPIRFSAGIKGKVLEAMAVGLPVVSTHFGAYGINARHNHQILLADNPYEFSQQVIRLLNDNLLYERLAVNARKLVEEKYDWRKIAHNLDTVYKKTIYDFNKNNILFLDILDKTKQVVKEAVSDFSYTHNNLFPEELHLELTYRCNSKCIMCDLWDFYRRNPSFKIKDELNLDEIKKFVEISKYLQNIKTVLFSGGEPFLRKDFVKICGFFSQWYPK